MAIGQKETLVICTNLTTPYYLFPYWHTVIFTTSHSYYLSLLTERAQLIKTLVL